MENKQDKIVTETKGETGKGENPGKERPPGRGTKKKQWGLKSLK